MSCPEDDVYSGKVIYLRIPDQQVKNHQYSMVTGAGWTIAKGAYSAVCSTPSNGSRLAITIGIRYATVRRQGNPDARGMERQVIQYPSTYYRLLPILSRAYVFILLGRQTVIYKAYERCP